MESRTKTQTAIFAAGCFWGVQAVFDQVPGVASTIAGYIGGHTKNPTYAEVCSGATGHAEAVEIEFNPKKITYEMLLKIFWMNHNPTTINRQGPDIGEQYRSAIFYLNETQKKEALNSLKEHKKDFKKSIVTEIVKADKFYPAEDYHQKYYKTHSISCHVKNFENS